MRTALLFVILVIGTVLGQANRLIPESLPEAKRKSLEKYITKLEKPKEFIPANARWSDRTPTGVQVPEKNPPPTPAAPIREFLAEIRPQKATTVAGPERADVYWYRPNPVKGQAGITVKKVIDLGTGAQVGETEVLVNHAPPLTTEEKAEALKLAREKSANVKKIFDGIDPSQVEMATLFDQVSTKVPDGEPGDRVVMLQIRRKGSPNVASVTINVTRETVRDRN